ncbi:hypothetical protein LOK49_Contig207G00002 [Camellia lanceoleosa]|nr:hypothetical protein LOK49_Contig207G00002 [Camellia lanceoleosa]
MVVVLYSTVLHFHQLLSTPAEEEAVVAIGGDYAILLGDHRLHSDRHSFLTIVEVVETADQLCFVERISGNLHPTHHRHISEKGYELFGGGGDSARWCSQLWPVKGTVISTVMEVESSVENEWRKDGVYETMV